MTIFKLIIFGIIILFAVIGYAACMVAHTSDAKAEEMYQDYLKYKRDKERRKHNPKVEVCA